MALIKCHECGKEVSDSAVSCPNCGFGVADKVKADTEQKEREERERIEQEQAEQKRIADEERERKERDIERLLKKERWEKEKITQEKKEKAWKRNRIIALIAGLLIIAGIFYVDFYVKPSESYQKALALYEKGEYKQAEEMFILLSGYQDSRTLAQDCGYNRGLQYIKDNWHEDAMEIFKSLGDYKDSKQMALDSEYNYACSLITKKPKDAKAIFETIRHYKDSTEQITKCNYWIARFEYREGNVESAKEMFLELADYEDSVKYLSDIEVLIPFRGTWTNGSDGMHDIIIKGPKITDVFRLDGGVSVYTFNYFVKDNTLQNGSDVNDNIYKIDKDGNLLKGEYKYKDDVLVPWFDGAKYNTFTKKSDSTDIPKPREKSISLPTIGMTESQVRLSSWGRPEDINRTTTKYGIREQWVYSGNRYIYFENGVVTSIQD